LDPLKEMQETKEVYALIVIDKREATVALLKGKSYEIVGHFTSNVAGKIRAGGQSSVRFQRLREEATEDFFKRTSEKINSSFKEYGEKLKGVIVGGPGITKNKFLEKGALDYRLKNKIIGVIDTSYTDESGIREIIQKSEELLKNTALMKERKLLNEFLEGIAKDGLVAYGEKEVMEALEVGKVSLVLLSEGIEWTAIKFQCSSCGNIQEIIIKNKKPKIKCSKCNSTKIEELEEVEFAEFMEEKAKKIGAKIEIISTETTEGEQFLKGFGGIGAFLRYK
jgi:peptide chain release factor subunit 1